MPTIGKINVDFQVLKTYDPKTLLIADTSEWNHIEDQPSIIQITLPGAKKPAELPYDKGKVNILNSSIIGITPKACSVSDLRELPDGIYTIKVIGSPDSFFKERLYLRTERLQLEVDKLYLALGIDFEPEKKEFRDRLFNIDAMLKAAEASVRLGDVSKTSLYFNEAKKLLEDYVDCIDC